MVINSNLVRLLILKPYKIYYHLLAGGDFSFEYITTTTTYVLYRSGSIIGDWTTTGNVYIVNGYRIGMPSSNPNGLLYECMLQTATSLSRSSIKKTFTNLVLGATYRLSFYHALRLNYYGPMSYSVIVGGTPAYSTVPSTNTWEKVTLSDFIADSTSISLEFAISSTDNLDRDMGINAVNLLFVSGTYILRDAFVDVPMFVFMYAYAYLHVRASYMRNFFYYVY